MYRNKEFFKTPIIFVTSRSTNIDELMGITLGADDFITKPYNTQILFSKSSFSFEKSIS